MEIHKRGDKMQGSDLLRRPETLSKTKYLTKIIRESMSSSSSYSERCSLQAGLRSAAKFQRRMFIFMLLVLKREHFELLGGNQAGCSSK